VELDSSALADYGEVPNPIAFILILEELSQIADSYSQLVCSLIKPPPNGDIDFALQNLLEIFVLQRISKPDGKVDRVGAKSAPDSALGETGDKRISALDPRATRTSTRSI
jgi:hypothetical protein